MIAESRLSFADIVASLAPRPARSLNEELTRLPALSDEHRRCYVSGGWPSYWRTPPPKTEAVKVVAGYNPKGQPFYRTRFQNLEEPGGRNCYDNTDRINVPVEVASRAATLSIIRNMRAVGWSFTDTYAMCERTDAVGMRWLHACPDFDREFLRCWHKAGVPKADLAPRAKGPEFVSNSTDRKKVLAYIAEHPGLGRNELLKTKAGLDGKKVEGRIKAALVELLAADLICRQPGSNRSQKHFLSVPQSSPYSEDYVMPHLMKGTKKMTDNNPLVNPDPKVLSVHPLSDDASEQAHADDEKAKKDAGYITLLEREFKAIQRRARSERAKAVAAHKKKE